MQLAELVGDLSNEKLTEGCVAMYFKRAFPDTPPRALRDADQWCRLSDCDCSDDQFNDHLALWLEAGHEQKS